jgi:Tol biopolymer transport system component
MSPGGGDLKRVTFSEANELAPAWSPDGSLIAFESDANGDVDIFVVDSNGNVPPRNITHYSQANDHGPTWSPDGQQIVFYANREGNWDIYSTTLDGTTVTNLTKTAVRDEQTPSWRP